MGGLALGREPAKVEGEGVTIYVIATSGMVGPKIAGDSCPILGGDGVTFYVEEPQAVERAKSMAKATGRAHIVLALEVREVLAVEPPK